MSITSEVAILGAPTYTARKSVSTTPQETHGYSE